MNIFTSPDYDEVHNKMLECYLIQPMRQGISEEESTNNVKTRKIESKITRLSTKGDNFERDAPYIYLSENS